MLRKFLGLALTIAGVALLAPPVKAGTFGKVVSIGGEAADVALDEVRGVLYIADFTANRIDVMSLQTNTIRTSIPVGAQPSSISLSPDGRWLIVAQYGNNTAPASNQNGLTLIDLNNNNAKQTFVLADTPLGVAFGADGNALVVTTKQFILFNPTIGTTSVIASIQSTALLATPVPAPNFPPQITGASLGTSADYKSIYGLADNLQFYYNAVTHSVNAGLYTSSPPQGPRAVSVAADGSFAAMGWTLTDRNLFDYAEFPTPSGILNMGGHGVDSVKGVVYSEVPTGPNSSSVLTIRSASNLTLLESIQLPEHLAGKSVLSHDMSVMYAISDSGVTVLPVGSLNKSPRLAASIEDLMFLGNFCDRNAGTQKFQVTDPGGNRTPFTITVPSGTAGVSVSATSGVTPATVSVTVDPNAYAGRNGTVQISLTISSGSSVDTPQVVRLLINTQQPDQRGAIVDVPGTLVDLLPDSVRQRYYVLRQDKNQVLVFNSTNNSPMATFNTCTVPKGMAQTMDGSILLVACDNAHIMSVFDLNAMQALPYIDTQSGYGQSVAVSNNMILAVMRDGGGGSPFLARVDLASRVATKLPSLGVYQNTLSTANTVVTASPNGATILAASGDGNLLLYDAGADSFTVSRKLSNPPTGPYAASAYGQFVVGNNLMDSSLVPQLQLPTAGGFQSGFVFVDDAGYITSTPDPTQPGIVEGVQMNTGAAVQPTRMVESPILGTFTAGTGLFVGGCTTTTTATTSTEICTSVIGSISTTTTTVCNFTSGSGSSTTSCSQPVTTSGPVSNTATGFTRSLALVSDRSEFVNLTTSGLTILPPAYAASLAPPQITAVLSAADNKSAPAPGGLITVWGTHLSATNGATSAIPLPTAVANSCLTVNGQPMPLVFVSSGQVNAQMPFTAFGNVTIQVHTPAGQSDNFNILVPPSAPAVFLSGSAGPQTNLPTVVRFANNLLVTDSDPVHRGDILTIYLTGLGAVSPAVATGYPAPGFPDLAQTPTNPTVTIGGVGLGILYSGLAPGEVGVYQLNVTVPNTVPQGLSVPLTISLNGNSQTSNVRVVQ
jgi:uncharacterized protein (TIGR03437 family)